MILNHYDLVDMREFFSLADVEQLPSLDAPELSEPPEQANVWTPF